MAKKGKIGKERKDKFYYSAKRGGFRSRAYFKLKHLNERFRFLETAKVGLDLCAAPGGWLKYADASMPVPHLLIGVDLVDIEQKGLEGVSLIKADILTKECEHQVRSKLIGGFSEVDVVLHDGAPNVGTDYQYDSFNQNRLVIGALKLACTFLKRGGCFVSKLFTSAEVSKLIWVLENLFDSVSVHKPESTREQSAETYVVAKGYKAPLKVDKRFLDENFVFDDAGLDAIGAAGKTLASVFDKKKSRQRGGYDNADGQLLVERPLQATQFISSLDPVRSLIDSSSIVFSNEDTDDIVSNEYINAHPATTREIKELCEDLQVIGKTEFTKLCKWRDIVRTSYAKENEPEMEVQSSEGEEEISYDGVMELKRKLERKRSKRESKKDLQRLEAFKKASDAVKHGSSDIYGQSRGLFTLKKGEQIAEDKKEEKLKGKIIEQEGDYDEFVAQVMDDQYEMFEEERKKSMKQRILARRKKLDQVGKDEDVVDDTGGIIKNVEAEPKGDEDADDWFENQTFKDLGLLKKNPKKEKEPEKLNDILDRDESDDEDVALTSNQKALLAAGFQQSTLTEAPEYNSDSETDDEVHRDADAMAERIHLAKKILRKKTRDEAVDDGYNRHAFGDDEEKNLPKWFKDEEKETNRPIIPVTKEEVEQAQEKMREIDRRPVKKVLEVQTRKKRRMMKRVEKLKNKANDVAASADMDPETKKQKMEILARKMVKNKSQQKKKLVVGRRFGGAKRGGNRKTKQVDKRMRADGKHALVGGVGNKQLRSKGLMKQKIVAFEKQKKHDQKKGKSGKGRQKGRTKGR